jgi:hypothetical protein
MIIFVAVFAHAGTALASENGESVRVDTNLITDFGLIVSDTGKEKVFRPHLLAAPEIVYDGFLRITPFLRLGSVLLEVEGPASAPFEADLQIPWQLSVGSNLRCRVLQLAMFDFAIYGEFEFPLSQATARINTFRLEDEKSGLLLNAEDVRHHVDVKYDWRRVMAGLSVQAHFGRWHPFLDFGYLHSPGRLEVIVDDQIGELLRAADAEPQIFYDAVQSTPYAVLGTELTLSGRYDIHARITVAPVDDGWLFFGEIGLRVPLGSHGGKRTP